MEIRDKVAVITGAASGIGSAVARKYKAEGARGLVLADVNFSRAQEVARDVGGVAVHCDVSREADLVAAVELARKNFGPVDIFVSNAGILGREGGLELEDELWSAMWNIHVMAHVWAARAVVPEMVSRGEGYFVVTASAAGLLALVESPAYSVTKHAAVSFAEWLRIAYGRRGVRVSCLCPQAVQTDMVKHGGGSAGLDGVIPPEQAATALVDAMRSETFLVLPHPEVLQYFRNKGVDYDRWLGGMQKVYARAMQGREPSSH